MPIEQMIYTSCPHGLGAGAGFQTQAKSSGLSESEQYELERIDAYHYPRSLPTNPTPADIRKYCPPNLQSAELTGGFLRVTRSVYLGVDYSGRHGNYLAHSLLLPPGSRYWAIDLANWKGWREITSSTPPQLEPLRASDLMTDRFEFKDLSEFVRKDKTRDSQLRMLLHALLISRGTHRPVLIRNVADELPVWVACILKCIPCSVEKPFSFATFVNTLSAGLDLQCTTPESDLRYTDDDCNFTAYVFDYVADRFSEVDVPEDSYANFVVELLCNDTESLKDFYHFAHRFSISATAENMLQLINCYRLCNGEQLPANFNVSKTLSFANNRLKQDDGAETLIRLINAAAAALNQNATSQDRLDVAKELEAIADQSKSEEVNRIVWDHCKGIFYTELSDGGDFGLLHDILLEIATKQGLSGESLRSEILDGESLSALINRISNDSEVFDRLMMLIQETSPYDEAGIYLKDPLMNQCLTLGVELEGAPTFLVLFLSRVGRDLSPAKFAELCAQLTRQFDSIEHTRAMGEAVFSLLNSKTSAFRKKYRQSLAKNNDCSLLLEEARIRIVTMTNDIEALRAYCQELDGNLFRQTLSPFREILREGWGNSSGASRCILTEWLYGHSSILCEMDKNIQREVASSLIESISLDPNDRQSKQQIKVLESLTKSLKMDFIPDRLVIREIIMKLNRRKISTIKQFEEKWMEQSAVIDLETGREIVSLSMARLLELCRTESEHYWVIGWCSSTAGEEYALYEYQHYITGKSSRYLSPEAGSALVLAALKADNEQGHVRRIAKVAFYELDDWLYYLNKRTFGELLRRVGDGAGGLPIQLRTQWENKYQQLALQRNSMVVSIKRLFQKVISERV
ncbi:GAP1-N2 domain-containing protein [Gimesia maris]|uniref:DUF4132 domain-containing protein n=1 Tax=Gimesia maris TaxID=122 RepID=A0ABX5YRQ3_9PLAN|nr:hypothetical protein [Gimesia maris]EDL59225.1 hypothetical protein PM8797T_23299 [Gimesia maris DSM 8797]QEG18232.1 hypothetical protein GmarT_41180 [Gimesia maris]QGQ28769.1 hypothetical protein F1729_09000 [Gimesia maris]